MLYIKVEKEIIKISLDNKEITYFFEEQKELFQMLLKKLKNVKIKEVGEGYSVKVLPHYKKFLFRFLKSIELGEVGEKEIKESKLLKLIK